MRKRHEGSIFQFQHDKNLRQLQRVARVVPYLFREALEKDGWTITHDDFPFKVGKVGFRIDLGAERLLIAEKGLEFDGIQNIRHRLSIHSCRLFDCIRKYHDRCSGACGMVSCINERKGFKLGCKFRGVPFRVRVRCSF